MSACINMVSVRLTFPEQPKRCPWTEREYQSLLLHLEVFGPKWPVIGKSLHRSPSRVQHTLRPFERNLSVPRLGMSFPQYLSMFRLNRGKRSHGFAQIVRGGLGLILDEGICVEKAHAIKQVPADAGVG